MAKFQSILCDDIRVEDNGKFILVGAYTDAIAVESFPMKGRFSLFLRVSGATSGENTIEIAVGPESKKPLQDVKKFSFVAAANGRATLRFEGVEIQTDGPDDVGIYCAISGEEHQLVDQVPVAKLE